ncbi:putative nitric oxide synthase isoform X2 [Magnolia sinica]|uniref:putative nitric oxide synthase isoform X2 n=1 Tax=Magnolia sinica TaxID=86752 RepID=UPI002658BD22|nr:putative nitric oxide synthase isoform X2 [Magnolia sinica]
MAPQALLSLSPAFSIPQNLKNPSIFSFKKSPYKLPPILCTTTDSQAPQQQQRSSSDTSPLIAISPPPSTGTGAAAPTRGDLFLERQQSMAAAAAAAAAKKNKKMKRKKKLDGSLILSSAVACCYGCGAPLQTEEDDAPGYVDPDMYELKKRHRQLRTLLCGRCKLLSHGHMITAVGGNGGYSGSKQFISAEELREKLSHLRHEKVLIVKLVDIVDFNGSFLARVRDLAGANPIILVVTKVDLLPKGTDLNCVGDWVVEATTKKKLNVLCVHLTSSKSLVGIAGVASDIQKEKKGRDVYILGSANVGKSAFINALLKTMAQKDPVAAAARKYKPIQSAVPGTTLGPIQIDAFQGGGKLFDTPGVHLHHRQAAVVHSKDLPSLAPQNRLRGQSFPAASDNRTPRDKESVGLNGLSIFWGGLVRVDVVKKELGVMLTPPTGKQRDDWPGLQTVRQLQIKFEDQKRPACDIAISGLGWIAIEPIRQQSEISGSSEFKLTPGELHLAVHVPKPVEIFVRPPMPVGKAGGEWYEYRELTEKEEESRPKWYI